VNAEIILRVPYKAENISPIRQIAVLSKKILKYGVLRVPERRTIILRLVKNVENRNIEGKDFFKEITCVTIFFLETNHP
jgi:hypothetical protein